MKRFFVVMLLLFLALFSFSACDMQKGDTDSSVQIQQGMGGQGEQTNGGDEQAGGNETENNGSEEEKPKPVKPITNGGNINFN